MNSEKRILILGASSWLGYLLVQQLAATHVKVAGTIFKSTIIFPSNVKIFRAKNDLKEYDIMVQEFKPTVIVNFLRGEDDYGFELHKRIIKLAKSNNSYYIYASSVLALDGYKNIELVESLEAKGVSPYGIFKANCEKELYKAPISWCILRFASVQGYVPHKKTRNQLFLEKLAKNEEVLVDRGILQNRILASLLIDGILDLIQDKITGIIHFGAQDNSEEYHFLQQQAAYFGFNKALVKSSAPRNINLVAVPDKILARYGNKYKVTEKETLQGLLEIEELKTIKKS